ncbi:lipoate synthase [Jejuia pallidilutea]|uniref:Lipoate synthase n=1 Tax=Jejuia pallidilutea TaxID=504487 RepID=A0A090VY48_9FLAO|nr:lipoate synthase [Jejuia pallidilutea]
MEKEIISNILPERQAKPKWLRVKLPTGKKYTELRGLVDKYNLNTICTSGSCQIWENVGAKVQLHL